MGAKKKEFPIFSFFVRKDKQTDGQTDGQTQSFGENMPFGKPLRKVASRQKSIGSWTSSGVLKYFPWRDESSRNFQKMGCTSLFFKSQF